MQEKDLAICLRSVNYSETSQVVTLLTREHGKIACMAKGSKRLKSAMDGAVEPFSFGPVVFSSPREEGLVALSEFSQQVRFRPIRQNLFAMNCGLLAAELIESQTEINDPHAGLFDTFVLFLDAVQAAKTDAIRLARLIEFQIRMLGELGIGLVCDRCGNCSNAFDRRWKYAYFSSEARGLLCPGCEGAFVAKTRLDIASAAGLSRPVELADLSEAALKNLHKAMLGHFTAINHHPPKMANFFLVH